jgi:hypothetical protein
MTLLILLDTTISKIIKKNSKDRRIDEVLIRFTAFSHRSPSEGVLRKFHHHSTLHYFNINIIN